MRKFKVNRVNLTDIFLSTDDIHHLTKVLRVKEGSSIICYDATFEYECEAKLQPHFALKIKVQKPVAVRDCYDIEVYVAIIKKSNFELLVKTLNELNVFSLTPVYFERSQKSIKLDLVRLDKIIENSCKQSERQNPIKINQTIPFSDLKNKLLKGINLTASLDVDIEKINFNFSSKTKYNLFIGPEGGFTQNENNWLSSNSIKLRLNNLILRTETATCSLVSILISKILEAEGG